MPLCFDAASTAALVPAMQPPPTLTSPSVAEPSAERATYITGTSVLVAGIWHGGIVKMKINVWRGQCRARACRTTWRFSRIDGGLYGPPYAYPGTPPIEEEVRRRTTKQLAR